MDATLIQLIETMRVDPGRRVPLMAWHKARLEQSCLKLGYSCPGLALYSSIEQHLQRLDIDSVFRLRVLVEPHGGYLVESSALPDTPSVVRLRLSNTALDANELWLQHKTTHRPWYAAAQAWLDQNPNTFDLIFLNHYDQVCEGSRSNIYIEGDDGIWLTPPVSCGLLPGVQRQALLDRGLVREGLLNRKDLLSARSIRVSNALRGWLPAHMTTPASI